MKKLSLIVLAIVFASTAFAEFSVNHNATLIPEKASTISGGILGIDFSTWNIEYTQGLKGTNLHVKASYGYHTGRIQALLRHCILKWNEVDMGFGYGGEFEIIRGGYWQLSPLGSWNMSYNFNQDIDFYGGVIGGFTFGYNATQIWNGTTFVDKGAYVEVPIGLYYGTQIDIASNLELYIELQTGLNDYYSGAYIGVNYYLSKGLQIEKTTTK